MSSFPRKPTWRTFLDVSLILAVLTFLLVAAWPSLFPSPSYGPIRHDVRVDESMQAAIKRGMTVADVTRIVGHPPGNYVGGRNLIALTNGHLDSVDGTATPPPRVSWTTVTGYLQVCLAPDGTALHATYWRGGIGAGAR